MLLFYEIPFRSFVESFSQFRQVLLAGLWGWLAEGGRGGCGATGPLGLTGTCGTGRAEPADGVDNYQDRSKSCSNYSIALRTVRNCSVSCAEVTTLWFKLPQFAPLKI